MIEFKSQLLIISNHGSRQQSLGLRELVLVRRLIGSFFRSTLVAGNWTKSPMQLI